MFQQSTDALHHFKVIRLHSNSGTTDEFNTLQRDEYFQIIWLHNGKGTHSIDLHEYVYEGPVVFIIAPGQLHKIIPQIPSDGYLLKFAPGVFSHEKDFFDYMLDTCLFDRVNACHTIKIPVSLQPLLEEVFSRMLEEYRQPGSGTDKLFTAYLRILVTHLNRVKRALLEEGPALNHPQYELFRAFRIAVEKHYRQEHALPFYAQLLSATVRQLNNVTRKYVDKSAGEIIQDRLILEAKRRLYHDTRSVKEICFELGFEDPGYFTRFFKKHAGIAPQHFKAQRLEGYDVEKYK
ncbi:AraC family transcriptional regulator [Chitinophaga vietnamensis]|uniref:AraC family transcriptional regulator n=1 Tax=Chitinophaga vietnamensis TaxID=2593957 RepID=UPI0011775457|nr:helix-turn-helix domain-containing protein [Chitinophaga vietnamensis]